MPKISVCIITRSRTDRVKAVLEGLRGNTELPAEVLVVHMNEPAAGYGEMPFSLHKIRMNDAHALPLARARNVAAKEARHEGLVFLDADCIPAQNLVGNYRRELLDGQILTGNVRYLDADFSPEKNLNDISVPHPARQLSPGEVPYELFWSLNFSCTKNTFRTIGGFDPVFTGYGAEDTDFAFSARKKGIVLFYADADVYHQYHPSYRPPLNHLESIIMNAVIFYNKWKIWPMKTWLQEFEDRNFIRLKDDRIELLKTPSAEEIQAAVNTNRWGY